MGLLGSEPDDRVERLVERAQGESVTETKLTRVGSKVLGTGTFEQRPLLDYLRDDEQPHYALFTTLHEFEFDEVEYDSETGYWQVLVATDQRLLALAGRSGGDVGEVVPYEAVDSNSVETKKDGFVEYELQLTANGVECEFEIDGEVGADEVNAAADFIRRRAADAEESREADRSRGLVYEIPNFGGEPSVWRADGKDEDEDGEYEGADGEDEDGEYEDEDDDSVAEDDEDDEPAATPDRDSVDLPPTAVAGATGEGIEVVLFERRLRFERGDRTAVVPLAYVVEADVDDGDVEFEFGFVGEDGGTFEIEDAELEFEADDPAAFERLVDRLEARQSGENAATESDDEAVQTLRERYAAGELDTDEYQQRLEVLQGDTDAGPPVVPGGEAAVTTDDVMAGGVPDHLRERFDSLAEFGD